MATEDFLSTKDLESILKNFLGDKEARYTSHSIKSLSSEVEGYLSDQYSLLITYELNGTVVSINFFMKVPSKTQGFLLEFSRSLDAFPKEIFTYSVLLPSCDFVPRCVLAKPDALVLEDLSVDGFGTIERLKPHNLEQCRMVLKTLSQLHAISITHEVIKCKETGTGYKLTDEYAKVLENKFVSDSNFKIFYKSVVETTMDMIDELPDELLDKGQLKRMIVEENSREEDLGKYQTCVCHGDLWSNNILFKYEDGELLDCRLVDFQMIVYSTPGYDIDFYLYANTSVEFRKKHKDDLVKYYYGCLMESLSKRDVDIDEVISFDDILEGMTVFGPLALMFTLGDISLLYLSREKLVGGLVDNPNFHRDVLVDKRSSYIIPAFRENLELQKLATENLVDLQSILLEKKKFLESN